MQGQLTDERILYRCRKTVLEMLRDRGYQIGAAEIEEPFEDFEQRNLTPSALNMIVKRPIPGRTSIEVLDEHGNQAQMMEPIFVAFAQQEKLGNEAFLALITYMNDWSEKKNNDPCCNQLQNCILIVKGTTSQLFRKVSNYIWSA